MNKFGQNAVEIKLLIDRFGTLDFLEKKALLTSLLYFIMQSKPTNDDIQPAISASKLKPTFTPCVLLRKGVATHNLNCIIELPENELTKAYTLLLSLFRIAYGRRYDVEKGHPGKWWYWNLSDEDNIEAIKMSKRQ
ncbi:DUF5958 family protein [Dyadobacter endophyticus]|uniref:DUF5958 family protein n=1 Tax=Dyadobacter endophyticus TaxID=1749036 RepID=UPI003CF9ED0C